MLLISGGMSADLHFSLINTLCTAAPGFSRDHVWALSISSELYSSIMCNGNSMHAVIFVNMKGEYPSRVNVSVPVCLSVCFTVLMMELALCRQPVLILWPSPQLQRVGNKPFSSNLQTEQQSMGNYLSQSMAQPFCFLLLSLAPLLSFCLYPLTPTPIPLLPLPCVSFLLSLCFFHPLLHHHHHPSSFTCIPPALSTPQHLFWNATAQQLRSH